MCSYFSGLGMKILAIEIEPFGIFTAVQPETGWIQARQQPKIHIRRPGIFLEKLPDREWSCGFIAMDARRNIDT